MKSSVLIIVYKRPETTLKVFESLRIAKPPKLYIAANAPRLEIEGELEKCNTVREIFRSIDWDCEVKTWFRERNLCCCNSIKSAIDWFFSHEDEGIILEDDIVPNQEFYQYMDILLDKYRDSDRIQQIAGWSYFYHGISTKYEYSIYFSHIISSWGWGSWRKIWNEFDLTLESITWSDIQSYLKKVGFRNDTIRYYKGIFLTMKSHPEKIDTWDYPFLFNMWAQERLAVSPINNLVKNIGFGIDAAHTSNMQDCIEAQNKAIGIFPLILTEKIESNIFLDFDRVKEEHLYTSFFSKIKTLIISVIKRTLKILFESVFKKLDK